MASTARTRDNSDDYYRELLARVDSAIVETRGNYESEENPVKEACLQCCNGLYQAGVFVVAVVTEACVSLYQKGKSLYYSQRPVTQRQANAAEDGYEL